MKDIITLADGSGGQEMDRLIASFGFEERGDWENCDDDGASIEMGRGRLVFTTDSYTVSPLFFPGGNIGHLAFSGTVNDLLVMGAQPIGLSLSLVIEEGFAISDLKKVLESIKVLSKKYGVPIVTGDTKVMEKGKIDGIVITTSGVGMAKSMFTKVPTVGDAVIISGGLGEHAVALLSQRFDFTTTVQTDSKPLVKEMDAIRAWVKVAKDPTRGGIASALNEIARRHRIGIELEEKNIPIADEVRQATQMLGIEPYELACEGRVICIVEKENADAVVKKLKGFNTDATIIGKITEGSQVTIQTHLGKRYLPTPTGRIVPRIC